MNPSPAMSPIAPTISLASGGHSPSLLAGGSPEFIGPPSVGKKRERAAKRVLSEAKQHSWGHLRQATGDSVSSSVAAQMSTSTCSSTVSSTIFERRARKPNRVGRQNTSDKANREHSERKSPKRGKLQLSCSAANSPAASEVSSSPSRQPLNAASPGEYLMSLISGSPSETLPSAATTTPETPVDPLSSTFGAGNEPSVVGYSQEDVEGSFGRSPERVRRAIGGAEGHAGSGEEETLKRGSGKRQGKVPKHERKGPKSTAKAKHVDDEVSAFGQTKLPARAPVPAPLPVPELPPQQPQVLGRGEAAISPTNAMAPWDMPERGNPRLSWRRQRQQEHAAAAETPQPQEHRNRWSPRSGGSSSPQAPSFGCSGAEAVDLDPSLQDISTPAASPDEGHTGPPNGFSGTFGRGSGAFQIASVATPGRVGSPTQASKGAFPGVGNCEASCASVNGQPIGVALLNEGVCNHIFAGAMLSGDRCYPKVTVMAEADAMSIGCASDTSPKSRATAMESSRGAPAVIPSVYTWGSKKPSADTKRCRKASVVRLPRTLEEWCAKPRPYGRGAAHSVHADWTSAVREVQRQRAVGVRGVDNAALARWYVPYIGILLLYVIVTGIVGLGDHSCALHILMLIGISIGHFTRLIALDHRLFAAIDFCASEEVLRQMQAPLGWGENSGVFAAELSQALVALRIKPGSLLLAREHRSVPRRLYICLGVGVALVLLLRLVRSIGVGESKEGRTIWPASEASVASIGAIVLVAFGCAHGAAGVRSRTRAEEADQRVEVLEAAVNSMLDMLRPLLGAGAGPVDPPGTAPKLPLAAKCGPVKLSNRFSVRLVTAERFTVRATLDIGEPGRDPFIATSLLDGLHIAASSVDRLTPTDLGCNKAVAVDLEALQARGSGRDTAWVTDFANRAGLSFGGYVAHDDAQSTSVHSGSTASTRDRKGDQWDEFSLRLAVAVVTALNSRRSEQLEVFRRLKWRPPKAAIEEPCLIFGMSSREVHVRDTRGHDREDRLGLFRNMSQVRRLLGDVDSASDATDSPRSSIASCGTTPRSECGAWAPACTNPGATTSKVVGGDVATNGLDLTHLAVIFDTYAERDICEAALRRLMMSSNDSSVV